MAGDPQIQFLVNLGVPLPGTVPSVLSNVKSPFTKNSTTGKIQLQTDPGKVYDILEFIQFNDAAADFYKNAQNLKTTNPQLRKKEFAKTFMLFDVVAIAATNEPATITPEGVLTVNTPGVFLISVAFDPAAIAAYNSLAQQTYDTRINQVSVGFAPDLTRKEDERLLDGIPALVESTSDPLGVYETLLNKAEEFVKKGLSDVAGGISSISQYLMTVALGATEEFNSFIQDLREGASSIDPTFGKFVGNQIDAISNKIEDNAKSSWIGGLLNISLDDVPAIGPGLRFIERTIIAAVTIGQSLTSGITNLAESLVREAFDRIEEFLNIDDKLLGMAATVLGTTPETIKKVLQVIKDIRRIQELLASGNLGEAAQTIKQALVDSGAFTQEEIDTKLDKYVNAGISFGTGTILDVIFPQKKGLVVKRDLKMTTNTVGIFTITNPKELGNNLQVTEIILKDAKIDSTDIIIDSVEIVSGGNFSVMNSETDLDDAIDFEAEIPIIIPPGQSAQIKINFRNPDKLEGILSIKSEFTYDGLKPDKQIDQNGKEIITQVIDEGDDLNETYTNQAVTPGSKKVIQPKSTDPNDQIKNIQDQYAKAVEEFSKSQRLLTDKTAALEEAKKVGGKALLDASKDLQDAQKTLEETQKKLDDVKKRLDDTLSTVQAAEKALDDFKKKNYLDALNKVDFKKLPPELASLMTAEGVKIGVTEDDIKKYYETIEEGVKKVTRARDLIGKDNKIWKDLEKYQQASLAERLRLTWELLNDTIDIHNGLQDIFGDPKNNIERAKDPVGSLDLLTQQYKEKMLKLVADGIKLPNNVLLTCDSIDEATRQAIGIALGIYPNPKITNDKKRLDDWKKRICNFFNAAEKVKEIHRKRENIRNEIVKRTNREREKAKNRKDNKTENKVPIKDGNKRKNEEKKINRTNRGKQITGVGDKIYRIDPIVNTGSPGTTNPIKARELSKEVTVIPVPEMSFYEDEFRTHYESVGITPDTIQDIYDNAEQIVADPIMDLKDNIESGNIGAVKGFISSGQTDQPSGTGGTGGTSITPTSGTGGTGGTAVVEGVTGFREFEEGVEGKDYGTYTVYADETKTKFSVDGQTLETPFLYAIYRYVLCSNDTPETSKLRAKANILKFKDELTKKYFIQSSDEYVGDDSCPNDEIQIRLVPSTGPSGDIILKREASEKKIRTGPIDAENTYIDSNGKIQEAPALINEGETGYKWRDKAGIQQPIPFVYPEDQENLITYDPSLFETKDSQNENQKSVREKIIYLLQTGGMNASRISFDVLTDGSVVWDGEIKINKKGLTGDGKIPLKFAVVNGKFDCSGLDLITLENSPKMVYGEFDCSNNRLTTLQNGPIAAVSFVGDNNPLGDGTGLKYGPQAVVGWPSGTILNGADGYIYSCSNCKLENLKDNGLVVLGDGGINLSKNKLKSLEEISDATSNGIFSLDISDNEFETLDSIPPIKSLLAFDENWLDYETRAYYYDPLNAPNAGEISYGTNKLEQRTTATINSFILSFNNKTKNLVKPGSGASADMRIREFLSDAFLPKAESSNNYQKPRATIDEIKTILGKLDELNLIGGINYPCIVSIRDYFSGLEPGRNKYRDAIFLLISETEMYSYNANTLPSQSGVNKNVGEGYPVLQPGKYVYTLGAHNGQTLKDFPALVQPSIQNQGTSPNSNQYLRSLFITAWKAALNDEKINNKSDFSKYLTKIFPSISSVNPNDPEDIRKNLNIKTVFGKIFTSMFPGTTPSNSENLISFISEALTSYKLNDLTKLSQYKLPNSPFVFIRDGKSDAFLDRLGLVQTNLHPGGFKDTWSVGCQTIPYALKLTNGSQPIGTKYNQWNDFYNRAKSAIQKRNSSLDKDSNLFDSIEYILVENPFKTAPKKETPVPGQIRNNFDMITKYPKNLLEIPNFKF